MFTFNGIESGSMSYNISVIPIRSNVPFSFGLGNSGVFGGETGRALIYFNGTSGKFYDQDDNYVYSYDTDKIEVSGNIFDTYSNYFINNSPVNFNCSRPTGEINALFFTGVEMKGVSAEVRGATGLCCG